MHRNLRSLPAQFWYFEVVYGSSLLLLCTAVLFLALGLWKALFWNGVSCSPGWPQTQYVGFQSRITLNWWSSCLCLLSYGITGVYYPAQFYEALGMKPWVSWMLGRCSADWAISPVLFVLWTLSQNDLYSRHLANSLGCSGGGEEGGACLGSDWREPWDWVVLWPLVIDSDEIW